MSKRNFWAGRLLLSTFFIEVQASWLYFEAVTKWQDLNQRAVRGSFEILIFAKEREA